LKNICLKRFLFLDPPRTEEVANGGSITDPVGYIILAGPSQRSLYVAGIFVRQDTPTKQNGLHYGYNIRAGIKLNRDRTLVDDDDELGKYIYDVWEVTFHSENKEHASRAVQRFLELFFDYPLCMDIRHTISFVNADAAKFLFKGLREKRGGDRCWFYDEHTAATEIRIIENTLRKTPERLPHRLWLIFSRHGLVQTAEVRRTELFRKSRITTAINTPRKFLDHSIHLFKCFLQLHPSLVSAKYSFRSVPSNIDIDAAKVLGEMYINHRNLLPTWVHSENETCVSFYSMQGNAPDPPPMPETDEQELSELWEHNRMYFGDLRCDCIANRLAHLMEDELLRYEPPVVRHKLVNGRRNLAETMPRNLRVRPYMIHNELHTGLKFRGFDEGEAQYEARIWEVNTNEEPQLLAVKPVLSADTSVKSNPMISESQSVCLGVSACDWLGADLSKNRYTLHQI
jgi:hypothetical protein